MRARLNQLAVGSEIMTFEWLGTLLVLVSFSADSAPSASAAAKKNATNTSEIEYINVNQLLLS